MSLVGCNVHLYPGRLSNAFRLGKWGRQCNCLTPQKAGASRKMH